MARTKQTQERSKQSKGPGKASKASKAPRAKSTAKYAKEALKKAALAGEVAEEADASEGEGEGEGDGELPTEKKKRKKSRAVTLRRRCRELASKPATFPRATIRKGIDANLESQSTRVSKRAVTATRDALASIMLRNVTQASVFAMAGKRIFVLDRDIVASRAYNAVVTY
jgi:histone H3/H4